MNAFLAIAWNSFRELLRQPLILLIKTAALLAIGVLANISYFGFGEEARLVKTTACSILLLAGLASAALAASSTLAQEIRSGAALTLLSKPVGRAQFLLAKFAGVAAALVAQSFVLLLAVLLASRMARDSHMPADWIALTLFFGAIAAAYALSLALHYLTHRPLLADASISLLACVATAFLIANALDSDGQLQPYGAQVDWKLLPAGFLITLAVIGFAAVALALSTRLPLLPTLLACIFCLILGLFADFALDAAAARAPWLVTPLRALVPNWQHFWIVDTLGSNRPLPWSYVGRAAAYAAAHSTLALAVGFALFQHRELR